MSTTTAGACPVCSGPRLVRHSAGLVYQHTPTCRLLAAEDGTKAADAERARVAWRYIRRATAAERTLLAAAGHDLPQDAVTQVTPLTPGVLRRSWAGVQLDEATS